MKKVSPSEAFTTPVPWLSLCAGFVLATFFAVIIPPGWGEFVAVVSALALVTAFFFYLASRR